MSSGNLLDSRCRIAFAAGAIIVGILTSTSGLAAQDAPPRVSDTDVQLRIKLNAPADSDPTWAVTLRHRSTWQYGSNFFYVDLTDSPGLDFYEDQPGLYLEYAPVLSLRVLGVNMPSAVLRDVGVSVQVSTGWSTEGSPIHRAILEGVQLSWTGPGFAAFNTQFLARQERHADPSWQFSWIYNLPFRVAGADASVGGFMDVWHRDAEEGGKGYTLVLAKPQALVTIGSPAEGESRLRIGVELEPSLNFPAEAVNQGWNIGINPMVQWLF